MGVLGLKPVGFGKDGETPELKDTVTIRDRDTGAQERISIVDLRAKIA
jgi:glycyl-tRNA synthetase (class II)